MPEIIKGRAWIELNMDNLRHNYEVLQNLLPTNCKLMPVVKANAYGHGAVPIALELNDLGVKSFCVATLDEGVALRKNGIEGEILILGYTHPSEFDILSKFSLTQTVLDADYAKLLESSGYKTHVHIAIDTGMHRLGERSDNFEGIISIFRCKNLIIDGMYTHLCASNSSDTQRIDYTKKQINSFFEIADKIKAEGYLCPRLHIQSSYGIFNYPGLKCDYARVGIALYGLLSTKEDSLKCPNDIRPVLSLKARVSIVKDLLSGETAGYGMQFTAPHDMKIAVISIGYADGIPKNILSGSVLINGKRAPIIGSICMDQLTVDVTSIPETTMNDIAVIIGKSGSEEISACELAEASGTITNEILSRLGERLTHFCIRAVNMRRKFKRISVQKSRSL